MGTLYEEELDPKQQCASCGLTRDAHWGIHPICEGRCTGFVPQDKPHPAYWAKYHLTEQQGKAVQEILNRYLTEELHTQRDALVAIGEETWEVQKDIDYITGLAKLFD